MTLQSRNMSQNIIQKKLHKQSTDTTRSCTLKTDPENVFGMWFRDPDLWTSAEILTTTGDSSCLFVLTFGVTTGLTEIQD
jgi:hypothetical protein